MARRRGQFATIPPPPQEGLTERELAFYTAVKQNLEMLTNNRTSGLYPAQAGERIERLEYINRYRSGTGLENAQESPTAFQQRLIELSEKLEILNNTTLPNLNLDLEFLNEFTLPTLQQELDSVLPITEVKISDDAISAPKLQANSVIAGKIAANAIAANEIAGDTITGNMIKADTITANNIESDTITGNEINGSVLSAIFTDTGTLTANLIKTEDAPNQRLEITNPATDPVYAIWGGEGAVEDKNDDGRFWVKHDGDAKFGGRVLSRQLEGAFMDAVSVDITGETVTNSSNVTYSVVADRYVEVPAIIQRPRRPFINVTVPVFGAGSAGAWVIGQIAVQADDGTWGAWQNVNQEYTIDTTTVSSAVTIAGGLSTTGNRGFRFRVLFRPVLSGDSAQTNRFTGIFMGLPTGNGYVAKRNSTGVTTDTEAELPADTFEPPDFGTGWLDEP